MQKNVKFITVAVVAVGLIVAAYWVGRSYGRSYRLGAYFSDQEAAEYQKGNKFAGTSAPGPAKSGPAGNVMAAQVPAPLTGEQLSQLKIGAEAHSPAALTFNVTGGSFYFTPNEIRVKQGDKVKIIFTNAGGMHNLTLPDFNVQTNTIKTGETDVIEFTANKKGTFEFYCGVGNGYHRQQGQIGVLLVE